MAGKGEFSSPAVPVDDVDRVDRECSDVAPLSLLIAGVCENLTLSLLVSRVIRLQGK